MPKSDLSSAIWIRNRSPTPTALRKLKIKHPLTIIALACEPLHSDLEESLKHHIYACPGKPADADEFLCLLRSCVHTKTQLTEVEMKARALIAVLATGVMALVLSACGVEQAVDVKQLMAQPKAYVGSDTCKMCHLEHFDSWKMTLHSRMLQDAQKNRDAIIAEFDEKRIREDLAKLGDKLKVPADKIYIPKIEDVKYTIGSQWKQRYLVEKDGVLYIAPDSIQRRHRPLGELQRGHLGQEPMDAQVRRLSCHRRRP